jgi:hypothetical protein
VVGRSYTDTGCGPFCLPPEEIVVWRAGNRIALPLVPGFPSATSTPVRQQRGRDRRFVGAPVPPTTRRSGPDGTGYTAQDLGVFPGTSSAEVTGFDDQGRMVGWSTLGGAIPTLTVPFMWSQGTGMQDLKALGYPNERPAAMSPGGKVVTWTKWYQLGNPASVVPLPAPPQGFSGADPRQCHNDAGDQLLVSSTPRTWCVRSACPMVALADDFHLGTATVGYSMGSINSAQIFRSVGSTGMIGWSRRPGSKPRLRLSPAYPGVTVGDGPMSVRADPKPGVYRPESAAGKADAGHRFGSNCLVSSSLMTGCSCRTRFPQSCFGREDVQPHHGDGDAYQRNGAPPANVVSGRFLDDY